MINIRRWLSLILAGVAVALLLAIAASFALTYKARGDAMRYLRVVAPLRIGTPYDAVAAQLHNAGLPMKSAQSSDDCHRFCSVLFLVGDKWLWKLHLAAAVGFNGRLDFHDGILVYKGIDFGENFGSSASVMEGDYWALTPGVHGNTYSSVDSRRIFVHLSPSDFTENRNKAYAFNVACIGSMRSCTAVEYLPTINNLERATPK